MKKLLLFGIIFGIGFAGLSQNRVIPSKEQRNHFIKRRPIYNNQKISSKPLPSIL